MLTRSGQDYTTAVFTTLLCAAAVMGLALLLAVAEVVRRRVAGPGP